MKKLFPLYILLFMLFFIQSCSTEQAHQDLTPMEFQETLPEGALLLDVRTQQEYDQSHLQDSILIPVQELAARINEIEDYKDKPVYVYCRSGNRSMSAISILEDQGFTDLYNMKGGITSWINQGLPVQ